VDSDAVQGVGFAADPASEIEDCRWRVVWELLLPRRMLTSTALFGSRMLVVVIPLRTDAVWRLSVS